MKNTFLTICLTLTSLVCATIPNTQQYDTTVTHLFEQCSKLPHDPATAPKSVLDHDSLLKTTLQCTALNNIALSSDFAWLNMANPFKGNTQSFVPFVQKLIVPQQASIYFFGDLHGNIHSLMRTIKHFKKINVLDDTFHLVKPESYFVFLGDYVDRGNYGIEVIYTLMRLRIANPRNVIMIRGNHEDMRLNTQYGFAEELFDRADYSAADLKTIEHWYASMPAALFLGVRNEFHVDFIQCCHGGPEIGFNASRLMASSDTVQFGPVGTLERADNVRNLPLHIKKQVLKYVPEYEIENVKPTAPTSPVTLGLMWADLIEDITNYPSPMVAYNKDRGWVHGKDLTHYWFKYQSGTHHTLHAIIRGHQHYGNMLQQLIANKGLVSLWSNTAYTVLSAPVAGKQFPYDAYTVLKMAPHFNEWHVYPVIV